MISVDSTVWYLWTVQDDICGQYSMVSVDSTGYLWTVQNGIWTVQYGICGQYRISVDSTVYPWTVQYDICGQYSVSVDSMIPMDRMISVYSTV
jgi:hypothetical protein